VTQYSRDIAIESRDRRVLGRPVKPGDDNHLWRAAAHV